MSATAAASTANLATPTINRHPVVVGLALSSIASVALAATVGWRQGALFLVGLGAGIVLYHAAFGFTAAWRHAVTTGRGAGLRAQMIMLAITAAVFLPLLADGQLWGMELRGSIRPLGVSVLAGAFLFGVGMQLGGGCASGTLFTAGGGNTRMVVTLVAFIAGSVLGALHMPAWEQMPSAGSVSLLGTIGPAGALAVSLLLFAIVYAASAAYERRRHGRWMRAADEDPARWLRGPWPLLAGALGLAAVNIATLVLAGRPWGITSGFALWGSKIVAAFGVDVAAWPYWQSRNGGAALEASVFTDITSVMNFGIILGALIAAGLAGRFAPIWRVPARPLAAAVIGGLLLGYGARIAYGCNIGAYFSGISSSSLHGWLWFVAAFAGSSVAVRMRPYFGLAN